MDGHRVVSVCAILARRHRLEYRSGPLEEQALLVDPGSPSTKSTSLIQWNCKSELSSRTVLVQFQLRWENTWIYLSTSGWVEQGPPTIASTSQLHLFTWLPTVWIKKYSYFFLNMTSVMRKCHNNILKTGFSSLRWRLPQYLKLRDSLLLTSFRSKNNKWTCFKVPPLLPFKSPWAPGGLYSSLIL